LSAVAVRYGSIATSRAPRRFACWAKVQKWRLDVMELVPQRRISFDSANRSTSMPTEPPRVYISPVLPADEQMVRSRCEAPSRLKKRAAIDSP
jgi:hypothetical protein